ncbi:MAG: DUF3108 domain-containing protein [Chitinophagaceae bacterium]|nr:DUF3108 domain-containing protein [Chitinophagaceae bacterium]
MKFFWTLFFTLLSFNSVPTQTGDEFCGIHNTSFQSGESINYHVYYTLAGIYVYGGEANFNVNLERYNGKPVYHIVGDGKTTSFFDGFFKVRDRYESYIDTASLQPYKFVRNIVEGDFKKFENVTFNHASNTATSQGGTFKVPDCVQDVLSSIYYARNIDFNKYKPGDKIPFSMFIDDKTYNLYIRYLGKEKIKTKYGKFNAIKFKPLLIEGTIFKGGEKMIVWVSDDANKIPVRIESPISVGSVKVDMMGYRNTRFKLSGLISQR